MCFEEGEAIGLAGLPPTPGAHMEQRGSMAEFLHSRHALNCLIRERQAANGQRVKCKHCTNSNIKK